MAASCFIAAIPGAGDLLGTGIKWLAKGEKAIKTAQAVSTTFRMVGAIAQTGLAVTNLGIAMYAVKEGYQSSYNGRVSTLSLVNLGASVLGVAIGIHSSKENIQNFKSMWNGMGKPGLSAVDMARNSQGTGSYPGVDDWHSKTFKKGDVLYCGEPNGTEFFTTREAIESVGANQEALFRGLQVEPHPSLGYRSEMQGHKFKRSISGAESTCLANSKHGSGGLLQEFVPNANDLIKKGILIPVDKIRLH